jgi:hypothetical protein
MSLCSDIETGRLIHAYEIGRLSEDEQERFEIHLLECEHCFEEVRSFEDVATLLREDPDVRAALQEAAADAEPEPPEPILRKIWRYLWPEVPLVFRPALTYIVLLLVAIPAAQWLTTDGGPPVVPGRQTVSQAQRLSLYPLRSGEENVLHRSGGDEGSIDLVFRRAEPEKSYLVVLQTAEGKIVFQDEAFHFDEDQSGSLNLYLAPLESGEYQLVITDPSDADVVPQTYHITIED